MPSSTLLRRPAVLLVVGLCAIAAVTTVLGRLTNAPAGDAKPVTLPDTAGVVAYPAFSPDGNRLAYSQRGVAKDDAFHLFIRRVPSGAAQQATQGTSNDISPAWSPDGASIAFLRVENNRTECIIIPANGGQEHKVAEFPSGDTAQMQPRLAWSHDGKSLAASLAAPPGGDNQPAAICLIDIANGAIHRITNPPDGTEGDWSPAISPDGKTLAFARSGSGAGADIYVCDLAGGNLRRVTFEDRAIHGLAFTPNGEVIYATQLGNGTKLWRIAINGGSPRDLFLPGRDASYPAVSATHDRLAYTESPSVSSVWRAALDSPSSTGHPILRSSGREFSPSYSPDGQRIADISDQSGFEEIWISDAEGGNRVRITNFKGPQPGRPLWSPDGKWLLFDLRRSGGAEVDKMLAEPGSKPVRLLNGGRGASWSHDGKSIYFEQRNVIWKASADGGNLEPVTERFASDAPVASVDGKFVYYRNRRSIWRIPTEGGAEEEVFDPEFGFGGRPQTAKKGIYYQGFDRGERALIVSFFDYATKRSSVAFRVRMADFSVPVSFSVSPDGKYILYPMVDQSQTNLKLVENFK
jgi:Tol biopolymer transport system component